MARAVAVLGADADETRARTLAQLAPSEAIAAEEELRGERVFDASAYAFTHRSSPRRRARRTDRWTPRHCMRVRVRCDGAGLQLNP